MKDHDTEPTAGECLATFQGILIGIGMARSARSVALSFGRDEAGKGEWFTTIDGAKVSSADTMQGAILGMLERVTP
jgi:hypothetical protein